MPSESRANPWSSYDDATPCWWAAEFPFTLDPGILAVWQAVVLEAGEETGVYRVDEIDRVDYLRERDGSIGDFLKANPPFPSDDEWWPDRFALRRLETLPLECAATLLSYRGDDGNVAEAWVHDMESFGAPLGLWPVFHEAPIGLTYVAHRTALEPDVAETGFSVSTDIWFPWTSGWSHREYSSGREILDNRTLGRINSGRLNGFLRRVRAAALHLGGTWTFSPGGRLYARQLDGEGMILDAPRPTDPA